ncbi:UDP-Glycosyltransferase/glycogen phosphorylase [Abortiporus biennis]|nr:UDP-Glycosyltransferase/glycogen phosphorylase [Abortiporus biennis]
MCSFVVKLFEAKKPIITVFTTVEHVGRIGKEFTRYPATHDKEFKDLVRVIALEGVDTPEDHFSSGLYESFYKSYDSFLKEEPVTCAKEGTVYKAHRAPDMVILDYLLFDPIRTVRSKSGERVQLYLWYPCSVGYLSLYSPKEYGGLGDPREFILAEAAKTGKSVEEVADKVFFNSEPELVHYPGLSEVYNHEMWPQDIPRQFSKPTKSWLGILEAMDLSDGALFFTVEELEPAAVKAMKAWTGKGKGSAYAVGPLLAPPESRKKASQEDTLTVNAKEIEVFMDNILESHGPHSMVFISFGSFFWPTDPEKLWVFLDVLMEKNIPFIMGSASHRSDVPESVYEKVKEYGLGLIAKWTPQQSILSHPATGWFVSHCGQNGLFEASSAGVPMICWPFFSDQPWNAVNLVDNLDVAYELFEVRSGEDGLKYSQRLGRAPIGTVEAFRDEAKQVLDNAFGADGNRKRENMKQFQQVILGCWEEGGSCKIDFDRFVKTIDVVG